MKKFRRNFDLVPKILSTEKFCPPKIVSAEVLSDKVLSYKPFLIKKRAYNEIKTTHFP